MKLSKTQIKILSRASDNSYGRTSVQTGWYSTRKDGGRYGDREFDAAQALVEAGLLERVGNPDSSRQPIKGARGGYVGTHYGVDYGYQITATGRAAMGAR